jgi:hypothetical protein
MTDISGLESVWKKEFDPLDEDYSKYVTAEQNYLAKIEDVRDEYKKKLGVEYSEDSDLEYKAHGLKGFFFIATKVAPLRRRKMKVEAHKKEDVSKIQNLAGSNLSDLADATARDSVNGQEFTDLETAILKIQEAREIVDKAAKKCRNASLTETAAAIGDNIPLGNIRINNDKPADNAEIIAVAVAAVLRIGTAIGGKWAAWRATRAFNKAARAVESLQQSVPQAVVPIVNQAIASDISSSTDNAIMMNGLSGSPFGNFLATMADWDMATQLNQAKDHLHDVSGELANIAGKLSLQKNDLAWSSLATARKDDIAVAKFASKLENRTLSPELWTPFEMETPKEFAKKKLPGLTLGA